MTLGERLLTCVLSGTLRYADRAKKIKNKVTKMENPTDRIIRSALRFISQRAETHEICLRPNTVLKEENSRLLALLAGKGIAVPKMLDEDGNPIEGAEGDVSCSCLNLEFRVQFLCGPPVLATDFWATTCRLALRLSRWPAAMTRCGRSLSRRTRRSSRHRWRVREQTCPELGNLILVCGVAQRMIAS